MYACMVLLLQAAVSTALTCHRVPGRLRQIDASNGQVYGVGTNRRGYTWLEGRWVTLPGILAHVSVGPTGVWAVGPQQELYRMVEGRWAMLAGAPVPDRRGRAPDRGGGGTGPRHAFCSNRQAAVSARDFSSPAYSRVPGRLIYYSCGPISCWGVDPSGRVMVRLGVQPQCCVGRSWRRLPSRMAMLEVASDGTVYAVNRSGLLFRRLGISRFNPVGSHWKKVDIVGRRFRHVTADLGAIWLVERNGNVVHCS
ncbi:fish-egg lectin-like [Pristis pectinata]|uniref:fish-egg lectin-like n=1 Tax=Pristis pectinata TaxID=685728 RepID=UPI00223DC465|nr:fish-egg lectin-like [Pristis pectinata]